MKTNLIAALFCSAFFSITAFAGTTSLSILSNKTAQCPPGLPTTNSGFCGSFKTAAICHCTSAGLPSGMCQDMNVIYNRMISIFGSQQKACEYQKDTSIQACMDAWNCYRLGGRDSQGGLCSGTGNKCS